ncbi:MAG: PAS domain S-box protein [Nitrospirae bacterium]|nr:PAS domain S-box protein [Nitrospirota bacterium]
MFSPAVLISIIFAYLVLLFLIAYYAERKERKGSNLVSNPYVYSLSLAVYCTSWTFYGSVGKAANAGLSFLTIYIGPTLMAALWWVVLRKIVYICKENRITTMSDFIASRYGNSLFLSALVTLVAVIGITPYLGLQLKAVMTTFVILSGEPEGSHFAGWFITLVLGVFAIFFGARKVDVSERHGGLIFAIAFESAIKLVAFISVGLFVTYGLFDGVGGIFEKIRNSQFSNLMLLGQDSNVSFTEWTSLTFLSMMAIMFLPRQFHVSVVENSSHEHIKKAMWLFPLYLFLINIFVLPIAYGGLLLGEPQQSADFFVLSIPLNRGMPLLALFAFIGGFSAATAMVIVESLALSTMVMNSFVMPALWRMNAMKGFYAMILNTRRVIIIGLVFLGYAFAIYIGNFYSLVDIGLKSFEAVTIFAPPLLFGIFWKGGNKKGAIAGILAGFSVWMYTLMIPALMRAGIIEHEGFWGGVFHSKLLNPTALFGLEGMDRWSHSLFWGLLLNVLLYVGVSIFTSQDSEEERQAFRFVESHSSRMLPARGIYSIRQIEDVLGQYIGKRESREFIEVFIARNNIQRDPISQDDLIRMRNEAEKILSGALGSPIAAIILEDKLTLTERERGELSSSIKQITDTLRLSRQELAEANRNLAYLKEFSENIIESAPVGIVTVDSLLMVKYWNREMETITGIKNSSAFNTSVLNLLPWIKRELFTQNMLGEMIVQTAAMQSFKININPLKDPSGGFVVIIEDITEKKKMEEQLLHSSKLASIGRLTAGISHEIGNPLASISSLVQEIRSMKLDSPEDVSFTEESLKTINSHIERIVKIVRSLGDFARISASEKTDIKIAEILDRTISLVSFDKRFKNIRMKLDVDSIPPLKVNPDQMQQVFFNLILNALDVMPEGGTLAVSIKETDGFVEIIFSDTGAGIEDSVLDRIFDPFYTTKTPGKGTGLGLSICYGIIKDHNGTINVKSKKGKGTTFIIRLPKTI